MQTATDNLMQIASELNAAGKQVKVTVLKPRKARRSELIMSSTKGVSALTLTAAVKHTLGTPLMRLRALLRVIVLLTSKPQVERL